MMQLKAIAIGLVFAALIVACGSGGDNNQSPKVKFTSMVNFGDSLSDVGTYKVGTVAQLGGGKYTVNSPTARNWTEITATQLAISAPCAAQTGLDGDAKLGFNAPVQNFPNCRNYAQGGARVIHPVGPGNKNLGGANATLGQLTVPVVTQIANHLTVVGGNFSGNELVTVMAGANDLFIQFGVLNTLGTANFSAYAQGIAMWSQAEMDSVNAALLSGGANAGVIAATPILMAKMSDAANALSGLIKTQIVAKGAKYTLVINLPNVSKTPFATSLGSPSLSSIVSNMTLSFNSTLQTALVGTSGVKLGDAYTTNTDQFNNPSQYGLSNVTSTACNLSTQVNPLGSSLTCNSGNVNSGDISTYLFADGVHPTPYGYKLFSDDVAKYLVAAGWL
jgi:phospholipase/lecithinase/hemolysin